MSIEDSSFQQLAGESVGEHLGFLSYSGGGITLKRSSLQFTSAGGNRSAPNKSIISSPGNGSSVLLASTNSAATRASSVNPTHTNLSIKAFIRISVPITAIANVVLAFFLIFILRKKRRSGQDSDSSTDTGPTSEATQPYLQSKAELEDEQRRRHGLEADGKVCELAGEGKFPRNDVLELNGAVGRSISLTRQVTQELWGDEAA